MSYREFVRFAVALSLPFVVAACCPGKAGQESAKKTPVASTSAPAAKALLPASSQGVRMQANPAVLDLCTSSGRQVEISWEVASTVATEVKIWVKGPDGEEKIWTEGGQTGKQATGTWTVPGTVFTLKNDQDQSLAQLVIGSTPCPK